MKHVHTTEVSEVCTGTSKLLQTTAPEIKPDKRNFQGLHCRNYDQATSLFSTATTVE